MIGLYYTLGRVHKTGTTEVEHVDAESQADLAGVKPGWKALEVTGDDVMVDGGQFCIRFVCSNYQLKSRSKVNGIQMGTMGLDVSNVQKKTDGDNEFVSNKFVIRFVCSI